MNAFTFGSKAALLATSVCLAAAPVLAQQRQGGATGDASAWGAVDGDIVGTSGDALVGVEIVPLDAPRLAVHSGAGGGFRIDSLPAGPHLIRFRRVGLAPLTIPVTVPPHDIVSADVVLGPLATQLKSVVIQGKNGELAHLPFGVADRARNGLGHYITATDIEHMRLMDTPDIFRRVAGLQVVGPPGREAVVNTRGASAVWAQVDVKGNKVMGSNCSQGLRVFINGAGADEAPAGAPIHPSGNLNAVAPADIALIEIYKDAAEIPVTLPQSPCGAIFIWTK